LKGTSQQHRIRSVVVFLATMSALLLTPAVLKANDGDESGKFLFEHFQGFSSEGMVPLLDLMQADAEGRLLLRRTLRKTKLKDPNHLKDILCYCEGSDLQNGWERRGLFSQATAYFYRPMGTDEWQDGGTGELSKLTMPKTYPVLAKKQYQTANFEHLEVAFRPKICLKPGMNLMQTYLVLYHELTHLVGLDHFDRLDLFTFTTHNKLSRYYYHQLSKNGGEVDAYIAQLKAFQRLKKQYDIPERWLLEDFLNPRGDLDYRDREAFMDHLLEEAGYREQLDLYLNQQILVQYNRAYAWWVHMGKLIENFDQNMKTIKGNLKIIETEVEKWGKVDQPIPEQLAETKKEWLKLARHNRAERKSFRSEQLDLERFMERVDRYHPRRQ